MKMPQKKASTKAGRGIGRQLHVGVEAHLTITRVLSNVTFICQLSVFLIKHSVALWS